jgi:SAM-dependent methyltransferase
MAVSIERASLYERYRLPYADEAVEDLLEHVGPVQVVADIGAGNGQLSRLFAGRCARLYAVEPEPAMREVAAAALADWPSVEIRGACAERTTLDDGSIDLIVVGNAFHRFRPEACDELRRILRPEGWAALFSYSSTNKALDDMLADRLAALKGARSRVARVWHGMPPEALFGEGRIHRRSYRQSRTDDWAAFFGAARAWLEAPEPGDDEFGLFEKIYREVFEAFAADGGIKLEYETHVAFGRPRVS